MLRENNNNNGARLGFAVSLYPFTWLLIVSDFSRSRQVIIRLPHTRVRARKEKENGNDKTVAR